MLDSSAWRDHLALEKRTATEVVTVLSLAALGGATFYNLGFFAPIEWSLISLLTVQDLIIAATISLLPMSAAALLALFVSRAISKVGRAQKLFVALAVMVVVAAALGMVLFLEGPFPTMTGFLVAVYFFLSGLAALGNVFLAPKCD